MPTNPTATPESKPAYRLSVSLTEQQHRQLHEVARKNRVSAAWVMREAIDRLLNNDTLLIQVDKQ